VSANRTADSPPMANADATSAGAEKAAACCCASNRGKRESVCVCVRVFMGQREREGLFLLAYHCDSTDPKAHSDAVSHPT
jgi:hypothetical protein